MEDNVDELPDSYFSKATTITFDKIDNGKNGVLPYSKFVELIETFGKGFHSEELAGHLRKVDPNESGNLERFLFVRWYGDKEVSLDSVEEAESLLVWDCKVTLMDLQREIFFNIHAMKRDQDQERISLK